MVFDPTDSINAAARTPTLGSPTGPVENFSAQLEAFMEGSRFISKSANEQERIEQIRKTLSERGVAGERIPGNPFDAPGQIGIEDVPARTQDERFERFFAQVRQIGQNNPDLVADLPTTREALNEDIAQEVREADQEAAGVGARATFSGQVGGFAGGVAGALTDPAVLASLPFGAGLASGVIRTAAVEGLIGGAVEIPIQAKVQPDRAELGLDAGLDRALSNNAAAAVGGAAFGGAARGIQRGAQALSNARLRRRKSLEEVSVEDNTAQTIRVNVDDVAGQRVRDAATVVDRKRDLEADLPQSPTRVEQDVQRRAQSEGLREALDTGELPNIRTNVRAAPEEVSVPPDAVNFGVRLEEAARAARAPSTKAPEAFSHAGNEIRKLVEAAAERQRPERSRRALRTVVDATGADPEKTQALLSNAAALDADLRRFRKSKGKEQADKFIKNSFIKTFGDEFDRVEEQAQAFVDGTSKLRQAVEALRGSSDDVDAADNFLLGDGSDPDDLLRGLQETVTPIERKQSVGRGQSDVQTRQAYSRKLDEDPTVRDTQVQQMRDTIENEVGRNTKVLATDEDGNVRNSTVGDQLNEIDRAKQNAETVAACVTGGTTA